jgi:chromosome segregation ATPase
MIRILSPSRIVGSLLLSVLLSFAATSEAAEQPNPVETKLKEALKNTMLQLRDAQSRVATLEAAQVESDAQKTELKTQIDALQKNLATLTTQRASDKEEFEKTKTALNGKIADREASIQKLKDSLEKWKEGYDKVLAVAKSKELQRSKLEVDNTLLKRNLEEQEAKNLELYKTGSEILTRYEKFSLGDALAAKEPFIGKTRVKMETLVQDYQDKLTDNLTGTEKKAAPETEKKPAPAASTESTASQPVSESEQHESPSVQPTTSVSTASTTTP